MQLCNSSFHIHGQNAEEYWITSKGVTRWDGVPVVEPEVLQKQIYCIEVLVTLLGLFDARSHSGALIVIWRPGMVPLAHSSSPLIIARSDAP